MEFNKFYGEEGLVQHCLSITGCKPYSGVGISYRKEKDICILRSVDYTYYYCDNLDNIDFVEYTLFGHDGDQDINEKRFNKPLLNCNKIYLYRVSLNKQNKKIWTWYGQYKIINRFQKINIGKDGIERTIIILKMKRIAN